MVEPKVSVVVPCYNVAKYIKNVYINIRQSTYSNIELIFVDDGSTDDTLVELSEIKDSKVRIIKKENGGVSSARNAGIEASMGTYIVFVDPDDLIDSQLVEKAVKKAEVEHLDFLMWGYKKQSGDGSEEYIYPKQRYNFTTSQEIIQCLIPSMIGISSEIIKSWQAGKDLYSQKEWGAVWRGLYRREILITEGIRFSTELFLNEDSMFNCEYLSCCKRTNTLYDCLYTYRVQNNGAMFSSLRSRKLIKNKLALVVERERIRKRILNNYDIDIFEYYAGSLVLSLFELYISLSKIDGGGVQLVQNVSRCSSSQKSNFMYKYWKKTKVFRSIVASEN